MTKVFVIALVAAGAVWLGAQAPASAASKTDAIQNAAQTVDLSAARRHRRVVRRYEAPRYYGYYGPTYYERPYSRPVSPFWFGGGYW